MAMQDKGGMAGYSAAVPKKKKNKKVAAKKAAAKGNFKPGGSYTSGRAIPPSPGTKYTGGSKKESNMKKAIVRNANPRGSY